MDKQSSQLILTNEQMERFSLTWSGSHLCPQQREKLEMKETFTNCLFSTLLQL